MFKEDLIQWERFERFVIKICKHKFWFEVWKNPDEKGVDLLWQWFQIECKYDIASKKTGNYYFEYWCNWVKSWILKYNCDYFCIWDENNFWIYDRVVLWTFAQQVWKQVIGWDRNASLWFIVDIEKISHLALYTYERWKI